LVTTGEAGIEKIAVFFHWGLNLPVIVAGWGGGVRGDGDGTFVSRLWDLVLFLWRGCVAALYLL